LSRSKANFKFHEQTWQAFWSAVVEGRDAAQVAGELGMKPGAVRVCKSRVLSRLRRELGDIQQ
jgi:RNA polymerase sigma-70 factor (ECF subfamily)